MEFKKLYTVEDVARMTGLTSRTIRNYLKDGKLKGKKIGVQWRFTEEDINELFEDKDFYDSVEVTKNQIVIDFINNEEVNEISICAIIDYPCKDVAIMEDLYKKVSQVVNVYIKKELKSFPIFIRRTIKKQGL